MMQLTEAIASQLNIARQLIRHHTIQPYYQPKVDLKTHAVVGFEALLRWHTTSTKEVCLLRLLKLLKTTI